jgi:hypothetical protein
MQRRLSTLVMTATAAIQSWLASLRTVIPVEAMTYRPEKHYMRGPRPK